MRCGDPTFKPLESFTNIHECLLGSPPLDWCNAYVLLLDLDVLFHVGWGRGCNGIV